MTPAETTTALATLRDRLTPLLERAGRRREVIEARLETQLPRLVDALLRLYAHRWDVAWHLEDIVETALKAAIARPEPLAERDRDRPPAWIRGAEQIGAMGYVDRFVGSIVGLYDRLPHLDRLGVTYLHLMPLFRVPDGPNDGGYAVSSYREVAPRLGTMDRLAKLAEALHERGIALVPGSFLAEDEAGAPQGRSARPG